MNHFDDNPIVVYVTLFCVFLFAIPATLIMAPAVALIIFFASDHKHDVDNDPSFNITIKPAN